MMVTMLVMTPMITNMLLTMSNSLIPKTKMMMLMMSKSLPLMVTTMMEIPMTTVKNI